MQDSFPANQGWGQVKIDVSWMPEVFALLQEGEEKASKYFKDGRSWDSHKLDFREAWWPTKRWACFYEGHELHYYTYVIPEVATLKDATVFAYDASLCRSSKLSEKDEREASGDVSNEEKQDSTKRSSDCEPGILR